MLNIFSKNNVARDTFKEVSEFMETSNFEEQVRSLVKSLKIPEGFLMKSEILVVKYSESTTEENLFSEKSWLNLVDFLKTQLKLYEESSDKESVQDYIVKTIKSQCYSDSGYGKNNNIDSISYLISYIDENTISYDIKEKKLVMTTLMKDCNCYDDNNNEYRFQCDHYGYVNGIVNTDLLRLLKMNYFGNFYNLCQNLDKEYCLKLLKYAIGLEDETWLTSFIVSEIKNNFKNVVESWAVESLKFHSKIFRLDLFPYNFYKGGNFKVNKDFYYESTITAAMSKMSSDGKYGSVDELIDYYKNFPEERVDDTNKTNITMWKRLYTAMPELFKKISDDETNQDIYILKLSDLDHNFQKDNMYSKEKKPSSVYSEALDNRVLASTRTKADLFIEFYVNQFHDWIGIPGVNSEKAETVINSVETQTKQETNNKGFFGRLFGKKKRAALCCFL